MTPTGFRVCLGEERGGGGGWSVDVDMFRSSIRRVGGRVGAGRGGGGREGGREGGETKGKEGRRGDGMILPCRGGGGGISEVLIIPRIIPYQQKQYRVAAARPRHTINNYQAWCLLDTAA